MDSKTSSEPSPKTATLSSRHTSHKQNVGRRTRRRSKTKLSLDDTASPPLPERPNRRQHTKRQKKIKKESAAAQVKVLLDPLRKDTILKSKEMYVQGTIQRAEFLKILTGSFTNIAIDVAEDYTNSCRVNGSESESGSGSGSGSAGFRTDTEEGMSSLLLPRVLLLAKFLLSVHALNLHTTVDAQLLVSEYLVLCDFTVPVSTNSEKVLVPLLVHFCQHVFQAAGMDKLQWSASSSENDATTIVASQSAAEKIRKKQGASSSSTTTMEDLLILPEGSIEFEVQKVVGMRLPDNEKKQRYSKSDGTYVCVVPLWSPNKTYETGIVKYSGEETVVWMNDTSTSTSKQKSSHRCKFHFPGGQHLDKNIMNVVGFQVLLKCGNEKAGYMDVGHAMVLEAVQMFMLTPQMVQRELRFQLFHNQSIKGTLVCGMRFLPLSKRKLPSKVGSFQRAAALARQTSTNANTIIRDNAQVIIDQDKHAIVKWPLLHKSDHNIFHDNRLSANATANMARGVSVGSYDESVTSVHDAAMMFQGKQTQETMMSTIGLRKIDYIVGICAEAEQKIIKLHAEHAAYGKRSKGVVLKERSNKYTGDSNNHARDGKTGNGDGDDDNGNGNGNGDDDDDDDVGEEDYHHGKDNQHEADEDSTKERRQTLPNRLEYCASELLALTTNTGVFRALTQDINQVEIELLCQQRALRQNSKDIILARTGMSDIDASIDNTREERTGMESRLTKELMTAKERITMQGIESSQLVLDMYYEQSAKTFGPSGIPWYVTTFLVIIFLAMIEKFSNFAVSFVVEAGEGL